MSNQTVTALRIIAFLLTLKSVLFVVLAFMQALPIPTPLVAGLAVTWILGAMLVFWMSGRVARINAGAVPTPRRTAVEAEAAQSTPAATPAPRSSRTADRTDSGRRASGASTGVPTDASGYAPGSS